MNVFRALLALVLLGSASFLGSCGNAQPGAGAPFYNYMNRSGATVANLASDVVGPISATGVAVGSKVGVASGNTFLEVLAFGVDVSIRKAAKNGGITKISTVDFHQSDYMGLVQAYTCIVTGE